MPHLNNENEQLSFSFVSSIHLNSTFVTVLFVFHKFLPT